MSYAVELTSEIARKIQGWNLSSHLLREILKGLDQLADDPKRRLKCELMPLDLYVAHTSRVANFVLRRVLPWLEPTRNDKTLREFPNYHALWGNA